MAWIAFECGQQGWQWALLTITLVATANVAALEHDTMLCADDNTPICGRSQGEYLLFKNECDLRKAQRENLMDGPLFEVALHHCLPNCEFECGAVDQPVCGVSASTGERKSFRNRCKMARASCLGRSDWLVYKWGMCPREQRKQLKPAAHTLLVGQRRQRRPIPCTNVYRPVCASYAGVKSSFSNECLVNAENIRTRRNWRIVSQGLCGEDSTKMKHSRKWKPKTKPKVDVEMERSKRSHKQLNQLDDFEVPEDAVQIFAPSTFHTQFISSSGVAMEKSYSLPARQPQVHSRRVYGNSPLKSHRSYDVEPTASPVSGSKPCVFSSEPVCGSFNGDSRTFDNVCALMEYSQSVGSAWTVLHEGACRRCDKPCPSTYSPICACRNGISYTIINDCYLERVRCKDPNSNWKITHQGECVLPADEVASNLPPPSPKPSARIPPMLYATRPAGSDDRIDTADSTTPEAITWPKVTTASSLPSRLQRKPTRVSPPLTPKDMSYRKIRKIEERNLYQNLNYKGYSKEEKPTHIRPPFTETFRPGKQLPAGSKGAFQKRPHHKKAHSDKYPPIHWQMAITTARPIDGPSTVATINLLESTANHLKSPPKVVGPIKADTETVFMMGSTAITASEDKVKVTTNAPSTQAMAQGITPTTAPPTTEATTTTSLASPSTTLSTISATTTTTLAPSTVSAITEPTSERDIDDSSANMSTNSVVDAGTSEMFDQSMVEEAETTIAPSETAAAILKSTNAREAMANDPSTTPSEDYPSDDALSTNSEQTSIYGLDKNSLIMRLLRARSGKDMVL